MYLLNIGLKNIDLIRKSMAEWAESDVASVGSTKVVHDAHNALEEIKIAQGRSEKLEFSKGRKNQGTHG